MENLFNKTMKENCKDAALKLDNEKLVNELLFSDWSLEEDSDDKEMNTWFSAVKSEILKRMAS